MKKKRKQAPSHFIHLLQKQQIFNSCVFRVSKVEPTRTRCLVTPSHGKKRRGRQPRSFLGFTQRLLGDTEGMMTPRHSPDLEISHGTHSDCRGALCFCCGAFCKVPIQIYIFLIECSLPEINCRAPSRAKFKASKFEMEMRQNTCILSWAY